MILDTILFCENFKSKGRRVSMADTKKRMPQRLLVRSDSVMDYHSK